MINQEKVERFNLVAKVLEYNKQVKTFEEEVHTLGMTNDVNQDVPYKNLTLDLTKEELYSCVFSNVNAYMANTLKASDYGETAIRLKELNLNEGNLEVYLQLNSLKSYQADTEEKALSFVIKSILKSDIGIEYEPRLRKAANVPGLNDIRLLYNSKQPYVLSVEPYHALGIRDIVVKINTIAYDNLYGESLSLDKEYILTQDTIKKMNLDVLNADTIAKNLIANKYE